MLAGSQYYITFDRVFYDFEGSCSYLLASDFLDRNFSIAISYNENVPHAHELLVLINNTLIRVDVFKNVSVSISLFFLRSHLGKPQSFVVTGKILLFFLINAYFGVKVFVFGEKDIYPHGCHCNSILSKRVEMLI